MQNNINKIKNYNSDLLISVSYDQIFKKKSLKVLI